MKSGGEEILAFIENRESFFIGFIPYVNSSQADRRRANISIREPLATELSSTPGRLKTFAQQFRHIIISHPGKEVACPVNIFDRLNLVSRKELMPAERSSNVSNLRFCSF